MLWEIEQNTVGGPDDLRLGQLEVIEHMLETNPQVIYSKKFLEQRRRDARLKPIVVNPKLLKIRKAYPYMERMSNKSTYKFNPRDNTSPNKHLVFENFQIMSSFNGQNTFDTVKHVSWKNQSSENIQLEKQSMLTYTPQKNAHMIDDNSTQKKLTGMDTSFSQIVISDFDNSPSVMKFQNSKIRSEIHTNQKNSIYLEDIPLSERK